MSPVTAAETIHLRRKVTSKSNLQLERGTVGSEVDVDVETDVAANRAIASASVRSTRNGFSVGRLDRNQLLHVKNLAAHSATVRAAEFSNDGSMLVSGGNGDRILIWKMNQVLDSTRTPTPTVLKASPSYFSALSLAISTDNSRIFAGGNRQGILVFDTTRYKFKIDVLFHCCTLQQLSIFLIHLELVELVHLQSLCHHQVSGAFLCRQEAAMVLLLQQPVMMESFVSTIFVALIHVSYCLLQFNLFLVMGMLISVSLLFGFCVEPVISQMKKRSSGQLTSVMFSPVESTLLSTSGDSDGTKLFDIRFPNQ